MSENFFFKNARNTRINSPETHQVWDDEINPNFELKELGDGEDTEAVIWICFNNEGVWIHLNK